jgi:hypothetical protein
VRDVTGASYVPDDLARASAYIALAHAEIQHYFDDRSRDLASKANFAFTNYGLVSREITALLCYAPIPKDQLPQAPSAAVLLEKKAVLNHATSAIDFAGTLSMRISQAVKSYEDDVRLKNNGIKASNLMKLFLPLGFSAVSLNDNWLTQMDSIGAARGDNVHKSLGSTIIGDPFEFFDDIEKALNGTPAWMVAGQISSIRQFDDAIDERINYLLQKKTSFAPGVPSLPNQAWQYSIPSQATSAFSVALEDASGRRNVSNSALYAQRSV